MEPRTRCAAAWLWALVALVAACGRAPTGGPALPDGAAVLARTEALRALLARVGALEATPLGRRARALGETLPGCPVVEGRAPQAGLAEALGALRCREGDDATAALGDADAAFSLALAGGGHLRGALTLGAGGDVDLELALPEDAFPDARRLLVPGDDPPGRPVLGGDGTLVHARIRPQGGLDVASLVADGGQAAQLFRLRSELFAGIVLDGTWEAAIYLPEPGAATPPAALALGFRQRAAAVAAMEAFVRELRAAWPVHRSFFAAGEAEGACLLDLNVLPDLAPCYVATDRALVVGWNPQSVRRALAGDASPTLGARSGAVIELARFAEADARLGAGANGAARAAPAWPWRRMVVERVGGTPAAEGVHLRVRLAAGDAA